MLKRAMDLRTVRHEVIASNIANLDTPGYKAFDIMVEEELSKNQPPGQTLPLERTRNGHLPGFQPQMKGITPKPLDPPPVSLRSDGNTVDLDKAMADLSENNFLYHVSAQIIARKFQGLLNVIKGGK
jgi:flagellar basal-body rod protein FlgB